MEENSRIKIGIVDDHVLFRQGLYFILQNDFEVTIVARNGKELSELLKKTDALKIPDIILLDIYMPVWDGFTTSSWLRENYPNIKVIILTVDDKYNSIARMLINGVKGYILKDSEPRELYKAIEDVMEKGFYYNNLVSEVSKPAFTSNYEKFEEEKAVWGKLSELEQKFIQLACGEKSYKDIAKALGVSDESLNDLEMKLFDRFKISTRLDLVLLAIKNGWTGLMN